MDHLLAAATKTLGVSDLPRPLSPFHGAAWRAGAWRIKAAVDGTEDALLLRHEAHAVSALHQAGLHPVDAVHGQAEGGVWSAVGWVDGTTLWDWYAPARSGVSPTRCAARLLDAAHAACAALEALHAAHWTHGDIQPLNILVTDCNSVVFIDHDRAQHPDLPLPVPYRGGLDVTTAPEIARELIATPPTSHVTLTRRAEVYSLGTSVRWAWTGRTPGLARELRVGETTAGALADIAAGRNQRPLADERRWPHPELEALITAMTAPSAAPSP